MHRIIFIPAVALFGIATPAAAQTATATMPVTATVVSACTVTATALNFGPLSLTGTNTDSTSTILLNCTPGVNYAVGLDQGTHASGGSRRMVSTLNGSFIPYAIFSDAARSVAWGNTANTDTVRGTAAGTTTTLTAYGRVPGAESLFTTGGYTDTVTVSVTF